MAGKRSKLSPEPRVSERDEIPSIKHAKRARRGDKDHDEKSPILVGAVTPSPRRKSKASSEYEGKGRKPKGLFRKDGDVIEPVTPSPQRAIKLDSKVTAKRKLFFGKLATETTVKDSVKTVYKIVRKLTGSLGGNGSHGPIYGELTMASMQKMVNLMKEHTEFSSTSRFIDVGSGIGKPNFHVAQDPGVEFSYGIEVEHDRWLLGYSCLRAVLSAASDQPASTPIDSRMLPVCMFDHADIQEAKSFDPFTHVYMFSIGFPPTLWIHLSAMWNRSQSPYLICYHGPRQMIHDYGFDLELLVQASTSMHGSKESHMGYLYKRRQQVKTKKSTPCDPLYKKAWDSVKKGLPSLKDEVDGVMDVKMESGTSTRSSRSSR